MQHVSGPLGGKFPVAFERSLGIGRNRISVPFDPEMVVGQVRMIQELGHFTQNFVTSLDIDIRGTGPEEQLGGKRDDEPAFVFGNLHLARLHFILKNAGGGFLGLGERLAALGGGKRHDVVAQVEHFSRLEGRAAGLRAEPLEGHADDGFVLFKRFHGQGVKGDEKTQYQVRHIGKTGHPGRRPLIHPARFFFAFGSHSYAG
jgi:hypothetical protein